jgi:hypothetical protein
MSLTRPEAEQVLRAAGFDGTHRTVLDAHYRPFCAERHLGRCVRLAVEYTYVTVMLGVYRGRPARQGARGDTTEGRK